MVAELIAGRVMPDVVGDMEVGDVDLMIELATMLFFVSLHLHQLIAGSFGNEDDLRIRLALAKDVAMTRRGNFEDHKQLSRPPFRLQMTDQRHRSRSVSSVK